jgi:hypothetical protein
MDGLMDGWLVGWGINYTVPYTLHATAQGKGREGRTAGLWTHLPERAANGSVSGQGTCVYLRFLIRIALIGIFRLSKSRGPKIKTLRSLPIQGGMACPVHLCGVVFVSLHLAVYVTSPSRPFSFPSRISFPLPRVYNMSMALTRKYCGHKRPFYVLLFLGGRGRPFIGNLMLAIWGFSFTSRAGFSPLTKRRTAYHKKVMNMFHSRKVVLREL